MANSWGCSGSSSDVINIKAHRLWRSHQIFFAMSLARFLCVLCCVAVSGSESAYKCRLSLLGFLGRFLCPFPAGADPSAASIPPRLCGDGLVPPSRPPSGIELGLLFRIVCRAHPPRKLPQSRTRGCVATSVSLPIGWRSRRYVWAYHRVEVGPAWDVW